MLTLTKYCVFMKYHTPIANCTLTPQNSEWKGNYFLRELIIMYYYYYSKKWVKITGHSLLLFQERFLPLVWVIWTSWRVKIDEWRWNEIAQNLRVLNPVYILFLATKHKILSFKLSFIDNLTCHIKIKLYWQFLKLSLYECHDIIFSCSD